MNNPEMFGSNPARVDVPSPRQREREQIRHAKLVQLAVANRFHDIWRDGRKQSGSDASEPLVIDGVDIANTSYLDIPLPLRNNIEGHSALARFAIKQINTAMGSGKSIDGTFIGTAAKALFVKSETVNSFNLHRDRDRRFAEQHELTADERTLYEGLMQQAVDLYQGEIPEDIHNYYERKYRERDEKLYDAEDRIDRLVSLLKSKYGNQFTFPAHLTDTHDAFTSSQTRGKATLLAAIAAEIPKDVVVSTKPPLISRLSRNRIQKPRDNVVIPRYDGVSEIQVAGLVEDIIVYDFDTGTSMQSSNLDSGRVEEAGTQTENFLQFVRGVHSQSGTESSESTLAETIDSILYQQPKIREELIEAYKTKGIIGLKSRLLATLLRKSIFDGHGAPKDNLVKILDYEPVSG